MTTKTKKTGNPKATATTRATRAKNDAKAKKATSATKTSQLDAAAAVLAKAGEPMNCKAMVEAMVAAKLWSSPNGKTPSATLYAAILREIATKGKESRFKKSSAGHFAIKS